MAWDAPSIEETERVSRQLLEAAQRGYTYLERSSPGWKDKINVDSLDQGNCSKCALAQLDTTGQYQPAVVTRGLSDAEEISHGFLVHEQADGRRLWMYHILTGHWKDLIAGKNLPAQPQPTPVLRQLEPA